VKRAKQTALQQRPNGAATTISLLGSKAVKEEGGVVSCQGSAVTQSFLAH
jgi:hypothetical protein